MLSISDQYRMALTTSTRTKAEAAYQAASRPASDHGRPRSNCRWSAFGAKYIAQAAHRMDQLLFEGIVDLGAQAADVDIDDVGIAVEIHVPDLLGDQGS